MKVKIIFLISILGIQSLYSQLGFDGGFENSTLWNNGWTYSTSLNGKTISSVVPSPNNSSIFYSEQTKYIDKNVITNGGISEYKIESNSSTVIAHSGEKCLRLGRNTALHGGDGAGYVQEKISRTFIVTQNNLFLTFWINVYSTPSHTGTSSSSFSVRVNNNNNTGYALYNRGQVNPFYNEMNNGFCGWRQVVVDLRSFYGQTVTIDIINSDCSQGDHGAFILLDDFEVVGEGFNIYFNDISGTHISDLIGEIVPQPDLGCNITIGVILPSLASSIVNGISIGPITNNWQTHKILIKPMKDGFPILGRSVYTVPTQYLSNYLVYVPFQELLDYWPGLEKFDIELEAEFINTTNGKISKAFFWTYPCYRNLDISLTHGNVNMYYDNGVGCNLYLAASPPVLNGIQGTRTSWALRAYKNGVPIPGSPAMDPTPYINPNQFPIQPVIGLAFLNMFWNGYKDYDLVFEATYTLCGKTYTYKTDVNGLVAGMNNDIVDPKYKAETLTTNSDNCTTTTTISYPIELPYTTFENKCKIVRKDFGVLNYKFDGVNGFTNYPASIGTGYDYLSKNTTFDCDNDILTHEIQYKCMGCKDEYIAKMTVATKCVITLCDQFECKPAQGSLLNPYLSNVKGNIQAKGQYVFNTKRVPFSANQSLKNSSYYSEFEPFYANSSNQWDKSTNSSWISTSTVENISKYGQSVETKNPLSIYSVMKYGFGQSLPIISANDARYHEVAFFSFEDKDYEQTNNTGFKFDRDYFPLTSTANQNPDVYKVGNAENAAVVKDEAHTGKYSYYIQPKNNSSAAYTAKFIELCGPETDNSNLFKENYYIDVAGAKANDKSYSAEFQPERGKKYLITYWTKSKPSSNIGEQGYIDVKFDCDINYTSSDVKSNQVKQVEIEGWLLMSKEIEIPKDAKIMKFVFNPCSTGSYFDDIRFSPINTVMKSYVYNPKILKHVAELDENNYATFFDYDEMGNLVRIRKETERGIMTIKEGRSNLKDN